MGEKWPILPTTCDFHGKCRDLLHAADLRHGTDGFTSPPKEGMLRMFFARKIRGLQQGLNPRTWVPEASMLTTRPLKPLILWEIRRAKRQYIATRKILLFDDGNRRTIIN